MQQLVSIRCIGTFPGIACVNIMFNAARVVKMARFSAVLQRVLLQIPKVNAVGLDWLSLCTEHTFATYLSNYRGNLTVARDIYRTNNRMTD